MKKLTLYTRSDCHLCDVALESIERVRSDVVFDLEKIDISADSELSERYGELIPVGRIDGVTAFEYRMDEQRLRDMLADAPAAEKTTNGTVGVA